MSERAAVLFANEAFYTAFLARDLAAMEALWAEGVPVACLHPGWPAIDGREEVMESWRDILGNEGTPQIACRAPRAYLYEGFALVVCYEQIGGDLLVATNGFLRQDGRWRMVQHQAGPCNLPPDALEEEEEPGSGPLQ